MDDSKLGSITQVKEFLRSVDGAVTFSLEKRGYANKQKMCEWIELVLTRLRYHLVTKKVVLGIVDRDNSIHVFVF